jgi:hypothetical protein
MPQENDHLGAVLSHCLAVIDEFCYDAVIEIVEFGLIAFATLSQFISLAEDNVGPQNQSPPQGEFDYGISSDYYDSALALVITFGPNLSWNYPSPDDITEVDNLEQIIVQGNLQGPDSEVYLGDIVAVVSDERFPGLPPILPYGLWGYGSGYIGYSESEPYVAIFLVRDTALPSSVPETSTWAMLLIGFAGLGYAAYRRARLAV